MEGYEFMVQAIQDGDVTFTRRYDNALEAVSAYNKFVDHGLARMWIEIVLLEPNGKTHAKTFNHPFAPKLQVN